MITSLSWKNIWRSKRRSFTVVGAIVIGVWALIFIIAFYNSFITAFSRNSIQYEYSHLQIHNPDYLVEPELKAVLGDTEELVSTAKSISGVQAVTSRVKVNGMIASPKTSLGLQLYGIDPELEGGITKLSEQLTEGTYFSEIDRNPILISEEIAEKLKVRVRSKVVLTFQDLDHEIVAASFRVEGIFKSVSPAINKGVIYVRASDLLNLSGTSGAHEVAVLLDDLDAIDQVKSEIEAVTSNTVRTYKEIAPEFNLMEQSSATTKQMLTMIIMMALLFGIVNTMLMAVLERTREIGMLRSIGMTRGKVFLMIILETCLMGVISGPIGLFFGYLTVRWFNTNGLDFSRYSESLESFGYGTVFYPELESGTYISLMIIVLVTAFIGAIYPAVKAIRLNPLEAIRKL